MNLYEVARRLWQERLLAILFAVLAVVIAILFTFRVSFSPPSLRPRALQLGTAGTSVLVDARQSTISDTRVNAKRLIRLTTSLTQLVDSSPITTPIAHALHVAPNNIGVQVQVTDNVPLMQSLPLEPQVGTEILATQRHYYLVARNDTGSQVIQLYAQAPTGRQAVTMVLTAVQALRRYVAAGAAQGHVRAADQVVIRPLGNVVGRTINPHVSEEAAVLIALLAWGLMMTATLTLKSQARRRVSRSDQPAAVRS